MMPFPSAREVIDKFRAASDLANAKVAIERLSVVISILEGDDSFGFRGQKWAEGMIRRVQAQQITQLRKYDKAAGLLKGASHD